MSEFDRTVFIGNYTVPKNKLAKVLQETFGPCSVKDPIQSKTTGMKPFGFATFESEAHARNCLAARRLNIDGEELIISNAKKSSKGPGNSASAGFQFGGALSNGIASRSTPQGQGSNVPGQGQRLSKVILSHSDGLNELYVQDVSGDRAADYFALQEELALHCQSAPAVESPQACKMYAGLFSEDGSWYRCTVVEKTAAGEYTVHFVDYGNQSTVASTDIKELTPKLMARAPAGHVYQIKDLIPRLNYEDKVKELLLQWHDMLLEGEVRADNSIDLFNKNKSLRTALINSGYVTIKELLNVESSSDTNRNAQSNRTSKPGPNKSMDAGDPGAQSKPAAKDVSPQMEKLSADNAYLKKQLSIANKKITQLADRKSIDTLNSDLTKKLGRLRALRPKFSMAADGALNQAISLLADAAYTRDVHQNIFHPVFTAYTEYNNQQDLLRQLKPTVGSLDDSMIERRNIARASFCEAVKVCQQKCTELKVVERRTQLNDILVKLNDFHPDVNTDPFEGDVEQTVSNFTQWQENEGEKIRLVQQNTEDSLAELGQQLIMLQQSLNLDMDTAVEGDIKLEAATISAISALGAELTAIDMSEDNSRFEVIRHTCCALQSKISEEFNLLDDMHNELSKMQKQASSLEPYFDVTEPQNLECMLKKEKRLKELRSQLRHGIADLDDLKESDDVCEADVSDMEKQVDETRNKIHSVLVELEGYTDELVLLSKTVFPEFAVKYPKFCLDKASESYIKPLRDITFYKDDGTTLTTFNGKPVVVKTLPAPAATTNYIPDIVREILSQPSLYSRYVNVDAVFFSKKGTNTYVQMSSDFEDMITYLRDAPVVELESLSQAIANTSISFSPSTEDVTDATDESSDLTSSSETNIGA